MSNVFNHLQSFLCLADILFLLSNLLTLPFNFGLNSRITNFIFPFAESCCHFAYNASIFLIISITIERWQVRLFKTAGQTDHRAIFSGGLCSS